MIWKEQELKSPGRRPAQWVGAAIAAVVACAVVAPQSAEAQPVMAPRAEVEAPSFLWMADLSLANRVELGIAGGRIRTDPGTVHLVGADLTAQYGITNYLALVGSLPVAYVHRGDEEGDPLSNRVFGNIGVGAQLGFQAWQSPERLLRYGVGVMAHINTSAVEGETGAATAVVASWDAPGRGRFLGGTTSIRLHGDVRLDWDPVFVQAELSAARRMATDTDDTTDLGATVGVGMTATESLAVLAELSLLSDTLYADEATIRPAVQVGTRYYRGNLHLGAHFYLPLDEERRDANAMGVALQLGLAF